MNTIIIVKTYYFFGFLSFLRLIRHFYIFLLTVRRRFDIMDAKEKIMGTERTIYHLNHAFYDSPRDYGNFHLVQVGRRYCESRARIGTHWQGDYYEMTVVTGGRGYQVFLQLPNLLLRSFPNH